MAARVSDAMIAAAREFERAAIAAGFEYARITFESSTWSLDKRQQTSIFGVTDEGWTVKYPESEDE